MVSQEGEVPTLEAFVIRVVTRHVRASSSNALFVEGSQLSTRAPGLSREAHTSPPHSSLADIQNIQPLLSQRSPIPPSAMMTAAETFVPAKNRRPRSLAPTSGSSREGRPAGRPSASLQMPLPRTSRCIRARRFASPEALRRHAFFELRDARQQLILERCIERKQTLGEVKRARETP